LKRAHGWFSAVGFYAFYALIICSATVAVTATTITYADCTSTITWDLSPLSHSLKLPTDKEKINTNCRVGMCLSHCNKF